MQRLKQAIKKVVPITIYQPLLDWQRTHAKPRGLRWGNLRRLTPVSRVFGFDRGQPIDRYYIEAFLKQHSADIRGRVLEIGDPGYTRKFGGERVSHSDVLHVVPGNPRVTLVGDLSSGEGIPHETFDCLLLTQTFPFIYDVQQAIATCYRALKPGGVLLATFPGISQISRYDMDRWGDYWRFTDALSATEQNAFAGQVLCLPLGASPLPP